MGMAGQQSTDAARQLALEKRLKRLKFVAGAGVVGTWLALWSLVSGTVAGTAATPLPQAAGQEQQSADFFAQGSRLGAGSGTPVLRSNGS